MGRAQLPYMSHELDLSRAQNLKPQDDESGDSDYDDCEFDVLMRNWTISN